MSSYLIRFLSGSLNGVSIPIGPGTSISIGRSHKNDYVLTEPDVSAMHCRLSCKAEGVELEVISSRRTLLDAEALSIGDKRILTAGQKLTLGNNVVILIENTPDSEATDEDDKPTQSLAGMSINAISNATPDGGIPPVPQPQIQSQAALPDDNDEDELFKTDILENKTRIASDDEIEDIKRSYLKRRRNKAILVILPIITFFIVSLLLYNLLKAKPERGLDWAPALKDSKAKTSLNLRNNVFIVFPSTIKYSQNGNDIEIFSFFGANREIPLHIIAKTWDDPKSLKIDRDVDFLNCQKMLQEKNNTLNFDNNVKETMFVNKDAKNSPGILLNYISYTRRLDNDDVFGYLIFFRYQAQKYYAMMEIPLSMQGESKRFQAFLPYMFKVTDAIPEKHWEGRSSFRKETTSKEDIEEARTTLLTKSPAGWSRIYLCLSSALIKSKLKNQNEEVKEARQLLIKLRQMQYEWYSAQKLAYLQAEINGDKHTKQLIQSNCEAAFTSDFQQFDFRYDLIRRKVWK